MVWWWFGVRRFGGPEVQLSGVRRSGGPVAHCRATAPQCCGVVARWRRGPVGRSGGPVVGWQVLKSSGPAVVTFWLPLVRLFDASAFVLCRRVRPLTPPPNRVLELRALFGRWFGVWGPIGRD